MAFDEQAEDFMSELLMLEDLSAGKVKGDGREEARAPEGRPGWRHPAGQVVFYRAKSALQLECYPFNPEERRRYGYIMLTLCPSSGERNGLPAFNWPRDRIVYKLGPHEAAKVLYALAARQEYSGVHAANPRQQTEQPLKTLLLRPTEDQKGCLVALRQGERRAFFVLDESEQLHVRLLLQAALPRLTGW